MGTKQAGELRELDTPALHLRLQDAQNDLIGVRFGLATRQTENTARLRDAKRQIARILTLLAEREQEI
ncbi:MAG TPA: 50S ribosomal protein L29 [Chloroflexota bacterium]